MDLETGGFNAATDAILEIAISVVRMDPDSGRLAVYATHAHPVQPFEGANMEQASLDFTGIDPHHPFRAAIPESDALRDLFRIVRREIREQECNRAVLVAHNAHFDAGFLNAAVSRCAIKRNPFHPFSHFDTATLAGLAFGHTVLARACSLAGIPFASADAHSALYDVQRTAELFCDIVNRWQDLGGWPPAPADDSGVPVPPAA